MRHVSRYRMRDFNDNKVQEIMDFDPVRRRRRAGSMLEFSVFLFAVAGYLLALAASN
jgi:hypothetical protein